jgi:tetratricopeptide (TPR) repeat protein
MVPVALAVAGSADGAAAAAAAKGPVERGDAAWADRARGARDGQPLPGPIEEAISAYQEALSASPDRLEARWKLLRALHFAAEFVAREDASARRFLERATDLAEDGMDRLARRAGRGQRLNDLDPAAVREWIDAAGPSAEDVARLHFWAAINWGAWSRTSGLLRAVGEGVANRLYRDTTLAIALEPGYDDGGPLRLLGRLHAELPRVPLLTGWVDRDEAIPLVTRAYDLAPDNPGNRLLLALTLLDLAPERRDEALALLSSVVQQTPRPSMRIEDLAMQREAAERLALERAAVREGENREGW